MKIGIDASRAFVKHRTGIEEYSYQVIKHLIDKLDGHRVILYVRKNQKSKISAKGGSASGGKNQNDNVKIKIIKFPFLWTQVGLSLEMLFHPVDVLFVPAHTVPIIHPARNASLFALALLIQKLLKTLGISTFYNQHSDAGGSENTIVTIHGLEYEFCPRAYSFWEKLYMRRVIKNSCRWAKKIIAVSNNTKKDLMKLYKMPEGKIEVVYEGCERNSKINPPLPPGEDARRAGEGTAQNRPHPSPLPKGEEGYCKYLLFVGRLEERKNIVGIIKAFEILKEQYKVPHKLILAGKFGYGKEKILEEIKNVNCANDIILTGYISEEEKWELLKNADVFLFPTFYEGFGLPILEAQSAGCPVVAGNNSSIPEITNIKCHSERTLSERSESKGEVEESNRNKIRSLGDARDDNFSASLVNPRNAEQIADAAYKLISDKDLRDDIIKRGYENVKRFSWDRCAGEIAKVMLGK